MVSQSGRAEWITPLNEMMVMTYMNKRLESGTMPSPYVVDPNREISYFGNPSAKLNLQEYDRYFSYSKIYPLYDPKKERDNRHNKMKIWENIFQQGKDKTVPPLMSHYYGRPCRLAQQYDYPEVKFRRMDQIGDFYRRAGVMRVIEKEVQ